VLINLLSNASRYGPPDEEIVLRVTTNPKFARVAIIDRGPGIPPEHRVNLFRRFVFPHTDDAISQAGAGLGLSVVKAIVTAQHAGHCQGFRDFAEYPGQVAQKKSRRSPH
jgi:two-component system heavy metal sensor histidine kinase CusS